MDPTVLYHMVVSSYRPHSDRHLSLEAERCASGAPNSRSEARAEAVGRRLQAVVRLGGLRRTTRKVPPLTLQSWVCSPSYLCHAPAYVPLPTPT
jgi:hypothetical protein